MKTLPLILGLFLISHSNLHSQIPLDGSLDSLDTMISDIQELLESDDLNKLFGSDTSSSNDFFLLMDTLLSDSFFKLDDFDSNGLEDLLNGLFQDLDLFPLMPSDTTETNVRKLKRI